MARGGLIGLVAAGAVTAVLGAAGVFAVFEDSATTGANGGQERDEITTQGLRREVDLQIATYDRDPANMSNHICGAFGDDLPTGIFSALVVDDPVYALGEPEVAAFCLRNVGRQPIDRTDLAMSAFARDQLELACTNDEGLVDPDGADCGTRGEAIDGLFWGAQNTPCGEYTGISLLNVVRPLGDLDAAQLILPDADPDGPEDFLPGEILCFTVTVRYDPATAADGVAQQSDIVRWRWRFTATQE